MKKLLLACLLLGMLLAASAAFADEVVGSGGWANWQVNTNGPGGDDDTIIGLPGNPYWNNVSTDGTNQNIGYVLTHKGNAPLVSGFPNNISYWGDKTTGAAATDIYFKTDIPGHKAALKIEIAGLANDNVFGWYTVGTPSDLNPIFFGGNGEGDEAVFTPSDEYGFYLQTPSNTFYTQSNAAGNDQGHQHFAVFQENQNCYWIGMEDLAGSNNGEGYGDFNDMVVKVCAVPEPGTLLLIGSSMVGMMGLGFRRRRRA